MLFSPYMNVPIPPSLSPPPFAFTPSLFAMMAFSQFKIMPSSCIFQSLHIFFCLKCTFLYIHMVGLNKDVNISDSYILTTKQEVVLASHYTSYRLFSFFSSHLIQSKICFFVCVCVCQYLTMLGFLIRIKIPLNWNNIIINIGFPVSTTVVHAMCLVNIYENMYSFTQGDCLEHLKFKIIV